MWGEVLGLAVQEGCGMDGGSMIGDSRETIYC
jgi:hypothetical protein